MPSAREQRFNTLYATFNRLPDWLWWPLFPWIAPVSLIFVYPVLTTLFAAVMVGVLAYLKQNYLGDEITWASIGVMACFPLWAGLAVTYLLHTVFAIGIVPLAIAVGFRQWREGRPFCLIDPPMPDSYQGLRLDLKTKLRKGKGLTRTELEMIVTVNKVNDLRLQTLLKASTFFMAVALVMLAAVWLLFGFDYEAVVVPLFFIWLATLLPGAFIIDESIKSQPLRCRHCGRILGGNSLKRVLESDQCPHCSGPSPLAPKPLELEASPLWDAEVP